MNSYEAGSRKAIPAVLIYAKREGRILMLHRNTRDKAADYHSGKWNGLGGKCEPDESPREAARRELLEESGLELPETAFQPLGVVQFPNFKAHRHEDWIAFVFVADVPAGLEEKSGPEGSLHWVRESEILSLPLWKGDSLFIPHVLGRRPFMATIWYDGENVKRHWVELLRAPPAAPPEN